VIEIQQTTKKYDRNGQMIFQSTTIRQLTHFCACSLIVGRKNFRFKYHSEFECSNQVPQEEEIQPAISLQSLIEREIFCTERDCPIYVNGGTHKFGTPGCKYL